jgi:hypothetical protein
MGILTKINKINRVSGTKWSHLIQERVKLPRKCISEFCEGKKFLDNPNNVQAPLMQYS